MAAPRYPLPNDVHLAGDRCIKSFASQALNHVTPAEHADWGTCVECGEVVNIRKGRIPDHCIPMATS